MHGHIPNGWHLRMFARVVGMEKTVDPVVFGFTDERLAAALTRLMNAAQQPEGGANA